MPLFQFFPLPFWLVLVAIAVFAVRSWRQSESSLRLPMLMVLLTATVWYVGDVLYNDYTEYLVEIDEASLWYAWWEVLTFICAFGIFTPMVHRAFNRKYLGRPSNLLYLVRHGGLKAEGFQTPIDSACLILALLWIGLMVVALVRTDFDFKGLFMPYLGLKADPWGRGRIGSGFDSLIALASYTMIGLTSLFGVLVAVAMRPATRLIAIIICLLTLPTYIFDRTRSVMLVTFLPGFLTWVFMRVRGGIFVKAVILLIGFVVVEGWLKFVIENRTDTKIAAVFQQGGSFQNNDPAGGKHLGLNMFEELGFINSLIADGSYRPNWGERYFAELVNPIPRALWSGKPLVGIDYAIARGQGFDNADDNEAGVGASISTGMIGQGVVNFGGILGPLAAALLMALWVAILARQDLLATEVWRLFLYILGLILTFNMGRDITLLVIYPFCIGYLLLLLWQGWQAVTQQRLAPSRAVGAVNQASPSRNPEVILNGTRRNRRIRSTFLKKKRRK